MLSRFLFCLCAAAVLLVSPGCESKVTLESFEQIEVGMDLTQVEDILGGPGEIQEAGGVGIGAEGLMEAQGESRSQDYLWGDENTGILVKFKDGKVFFKQKMGL